MFDRDRGRHRMWRSMFGDDMGPDMPDWFGMWSKGGRGPSVRRGEVRDAILAVLAREPMHGYRIIGELSARSGGRWKPSAGSIYPTLQQLEDEGLVTAVERDGKRTFSLTEAGREAASKVGARGEPQWQAAPAPGAADVGPEGNAAGDSPEVRDSLYQLSAAVAQAAQIGSPETVVRVRAVLADARKSIYRLLAEEDEPGPQ
jgi:DNA-binding PadR family transcriptional regulator